MQARTSLRGAFLLSTACLLAGPLHAQDAGGVRFTFDVEQRFEYGRNVDLAVPADGSSAISATTLTFGILSETPLDRFAFTASGALVIENSPSTTGTEVEFDRPEVTVAYTREIPDALFGVTGRYLRGDVADLTDDLADADAVGTQIDYGATITYEALRTSPVSIFVVGTYDATEYEDTVDPGLIGSDTLGLTLGSRLRFSEVLTGTLSLGSTREVEDSGVVTDTTTTTAGLDFLLPTGTASAVLTFDTGDTEDRTTLELSRSYDFPSAVLVARIGATNSDLGGTDVIGGLDLTQELPDGEVTLSVARGVSYDAAAAETTVDTSLALAWERSINAQSSMLLDFSWEVSDAPSERIEETEVGATYSRLVADRATLDVGLRYRTRDDAGGRATSPLVFLALGQSF